MWQTSTEFDLAMQRGHIPTKVQVNLWSGGMSQLLVPDLPVVGGSVTIDRTAAVRKTCNVQLLDDDRNWFSLLSLDPGENSPGPLELEISRGITLPNGRTELIPLGVYRVSLPEWTDTNEPTLSITGYDWSRVVSRAKLTTTYYVQAGTAYLTAAAALIDNRLPFSVPVTKTVESVQTASVTSTTLVYHEQDDPWTRVQELCAAVGCEVYFDRDNTVRIRDIPDPTADPVVFEFVDDETSLLLSVTRSLDDDPGYNATIVTGESSDNSASVPRGMAYDNDPASPTYYFGPYGAVPEFYNDPLLTDNAQCVTAAAARLRKVAGVTDTSVLSVVPHPALDPSDIIRVRRDQSGMSLQTMIQSEVIPLDVTTAMTLNCVSRISAST